MASRSPDISTQTVVKAPAPAHAASVSAVKSPAAGARRVRRVPRSDLVAAFCAAKSSSHGGSADPGSTAGNRYAGVPVAPLNGVAPQAPRSPPLRHTLSPAQLAAAGSSSTSTSAALTQPALTAVGVASSSAAGPAAAAAGASASSSSGGGSGSGSGVSSLSAAGGGAGTDPHQKDWKSLGHFVPAPAVPPLPWGYDDFTLGVGTVVTDPRLPLVLDAQGQPILPYSFRPLTIRGVTLKNRIGVSPMCQYSCDDGHMSDWHVMHLGKFAAAGAGLIIAEMTAVQARGRISPYCSGLWKDSQIAPLKRVVDFVHSQGGCKIGLQLAHAGRKASQLPPFMIRRGGPINALRGDAQKGWHDDVVGPSAVAWDRGWIVPKALSVGDIKQLIDDWAAAAKRADRAGVDLIELHGAHGYLINSFLSPLSNTRTDAYGGSFDNRIRFLLEVVAAVRAVWPEHKPLFVRLSCVEWVDGGWDMPQTVALVHRLLAMGVDVIDCSSGGNSHRQKITSGPGYQVPFSAALQQSNTKIVTAAVGEITSPQQVEDIVCTGKADIVLLGRQFLAEPHFVLRAAKELKVPIAWAPQYLRAKL